MNSGQFQTKFKESCSFGLPPKAKHLIYQDSRVEVASKTVKCTVVTVQKLDDSVVETTEQKEQRLHNGLGVDKHNETVDVSRLQHYNNCKKIVNLSENFCHSSGEGGNGHSPSPINTCPDHLFAFKHCFLDNTLRERTSDLTVIVEEERFKIHCYLFGVFSTYIQELIRNGKLTSGCELILENVPLQGFISIMHWIYTAHLPITLENALPVYVAAKLLAIPQVCHSCHQFLEDASIDCKQMLNLYETVVKAKVIAPNHKPSEGFRNYDVLNYSTEELCKYIDCCDRERFSEAAIFKTALEWLLHDWQNRRHFQDSVMSAIAFDRIPAPELEGLMLMCVESVYCENSFWARLIKILHEKVRERRIERTSSQILSVDGILSDLTIKREESFKAQTSLLHQELVKKNATVTDSWNQLQDSRTRAAITVQAVYRGYRTRKFLQNLMRRPCSYGRVPRESSSVVLNNETVLDGETCRSSSGTRLVANVNAAVDTDPIPVQPDDADVSAVHRSQSLPTVPSTFVTANCDTKESRELSEEEISVSANGNAECDSTSDSWQSDDSKSYASDESSDTVSSSEVRRKLRLKTVTKHRTPSFTKKSSDYSKNDRKGVIDDVTCTQHDHSQQLQQQDPLPFLMIHCHDQNIFRVHSLLLARRSTFFHKLLTEHKMPLLRELVLQVSCSSQAVEAVVDWIYTNKLNLTPQNACDVYFVADRLGLHDVLKACRLHWQCSHNLEEILSLMEFGKKEDFPELVQGAQNLIQRNFSSVANTINVVEPTLPTFSESSQNETNEERRKCTMGDHLARTVERTESPPIEHELQDDTEKIVHAIQEVYHSASEDDDISGILLKDEESNESVLEAESLFSASEESILLLHQEPVHTESTINLHDDGGHRSTENASLRPESPPLETVAMGDGSVSDESITKIHVTLDSELGCAESKGPISCKKFSPCKSPTRVVLEPGVLVLGGVNKEEGWTGEMSGRHLLYFNFKDGLWQEVGQLPKGRFYPSACVHKKKLYMAGGFDPSVSHGGLHLVPTKEMWCLDLQIMKWSRLASMKTGRAYHSLLAVDSDRLLAIGGSDHNNRALKTVECFIPSKNRWSDFASLLVPRVAAMACFYKGTVWVLGGVKDMNGCGDEITDAVESYDLSNKRWRVEHSLAFPRAFGSVIEVHKALYLIGGITIVRQNGHFIHTVLSTIDIYSQNGVEHAVVAVLDSPRCSASVSYHGDLLYIFGGRESCGGDGITTVACYNTKQKQWANTVRDMPISLAGSLCVSSASSN